MWEGGYAGQEGRDIPGSTQNGRLDHFNFINSELYITYYVGGGLCRTIGCGCAKGAGFVRGIVSQRGALSGFIGSNTYPTT